MGQFELLLQDIRYAIRSIRRHPGIAAATVVTLTLGLGLNISVFTLLQGLLFRARVSRDPASFVHLSPEYKSASAQREMSWSISVRDYRAYAAGSRTLSTLAAWTAVHATLGTGESDPVLSLLVTCNFFDVYGLDAPRLGRLFSSAECSMPGAAPVVLIGEEVWKNRFASDPLIVGKTVKIERTPFTIVGVLPSGFLGRLRGPGVWMPWTMQAPFYRGSDLFRADSTRWLTVEGRLKPGRTQAEARSELAVIAARLDRLEPGRQTTMSITNGSFAQEPSLRANLFWIGPVVMGALTLVLLLACTNVTVLQLSRAVGRQREMGIRLSIGAGRSRLIRMLLTEILLLAVVAGGCSVWIAFEVPAVLTKLMATSSMPVYQTTPDLAVLVYLGAIVLLAVFMAGVSPAGESLRVNLLSSMKAGEAGSGRGASKRRDFLVAAQVAMSLVLLTCAALFIQAQYTLLSTDPGFETSRVLALPLQLQGADAPVLAATLARRIREMPGVDSVAVGSPLGSGELGSESDEVRAPGEPAGSGKQAAVTTVSTDYFNTLRIPLIRGRTAVNPHECTVSQAFARMFWPGKDPLGQRLLFADETVVEAVGIARDVQSEHPGSPDTPHVYRWRDFSAQTDSLLVHFRGDASNLAGRIRDVNRQLDPDASTTARTLRSILDENAERFTLTVRMVETLAGLAVALAVLGIYGVVSFAVSQRTKELGIRMALGATKVLIVRSVLSTGARPVAWGLGLGVLLAGAAAQAIAGLLRHAPVAIQPRDPLLFAGVAILLGFIALTAMFRPALRAGNADPVTALRDE